MANLGNAWHFPANPEPRGLAGMRDPVFPTAPLSTITIASGNQFQGPGNPGNQLQDGSAVLFRKRGDAAWTAQPLLFQAILGNNKYYAASLPTAALALGDMVDYYLRIAYSGHDTTFLAAGDGGTLSVATGDEGAAQASPFSFSVESPAVRGRWESLFGLPNVAIHAHVLPTGSVLMWGRRDSPDQSLDTDPPSPLAPGTPAAPPAECTPLIWDPATGSVTHTPKPVSNGGAPVNLFCSGHTLLPDGNVMVVGGHLSDMRGSDQACTFDASTTTWTALAAMNHGRWYPTAIAMADGSVLVLSGSYQDPESGKILIDLVPQVWKDGAWTEILERPDSALDLYPRAHLATDGRAYLTGPSGQTWSLDISGGGHWAEVGTPRDNALRDYAPSVLYDRDKVVYIGGGNSPIASVETIDLGVAQPAWQAAQPMAFPRRQHNATLLPDGTVLVTGGTRGGGTAGAPEGFNNLDPGQPVHVAELWDPASGGWTQLAAEAADRCYHSTAVLLPDATVLSAGSGEFFPVEGTPQQNDPLDSHRDAQIFSPPYLFKGPRPEITSAPAQITYAEAFDVGVDRPADIAKVTLVRLSSVTHAFNANQRINVLAFQAGTSLSVTAPATPNECPPGHYMLFALDRQGVPSVARILAVTPQGMTPAAQRNLRLLSVTPLPATAAQPQGAQAQHDAVHAAASGTRVEVGITGTCPYGIAACWGGANEALHHLDHVQLVDPIPDADASTATLFLDGDRLPDLEAWTREFQRMVNGSYILRGVEVTVPGTVERQNGDLRLTGTGERPAVLLEALDSDRKVQWDRSTHDPQPPTLGEAEAYARLVADPAIAGGLRPVTVTGPLIQDGSEYRLQVRSFS